MFAELKSHCGLGCAPSRKEAANRLFSLAAVLAHNLGRELQMAARAPSRRTTAKRSPLWAFAQLCASPPRFSRPGQSASLARTMNDILADAWAEETEARREAVNVKCAEAESHMQAAEKLVRSPRGRAAIRKVQVRGRWREPSPQLSLWCRPGLFKKPLDGDPFHTRRMVAKAAADGVSMWVRYGIDADEVFPRDAIVVGAAVQRRADGRVAYGNDGIPTLKDEVTAYKCCMAWAAAVVKRELGFRKSANPTLRVAMTRNKTTEFWRKSMGKMEPPALTLEDRFEMGRADLIDELHPNGKLLDHNVR